MKTETAERESVNGQEKTRFIGIRPRVKVTKEGEAHPTELYINAGVEASMKFKLNLEDEQEELDFVLGRLPVEWRAVEQGEDLSKFPEHHIERDSKTKEPKKVPSVYEGLRKGDIIGMALGGTGDNFAFALAKVGENIGAQVFRIPPFTLKKERGHDKTEGDAKLLAELVAAKRSLFYKVYLRDMDLIGMRELLRARIDAMKARIACEQRLRQRFIGEIFCNPAGQYPQGSIEKMFDERKANDRILRALEEEEALAVKQLTKQIEKLEIFQKIFEPIEGVGPMIASRIISAVQDIRRFMVNPERMEFCYAESRRLEALGKFKEGLAEIGESSSDKELFVKLDLVAEWHRNNGRSQESQYLLKAKELHREQGLLLSKSAAKLKKFCGVHVLPDNRFPRRRNNEIANWHPDARQALYLVADQFNRRPGSDWGEYLILSKKRLRDKHPEKVLTEKSTGRAISPEEQSEKAAELKGKTVWKYTDGHIHKMGIWRTLSRFTEWLCREWWRLEREHQLSALEKTAGS